MKKFYIHDGHKQSGPFSLQELKEQNITRDTPIWHQDLQDWRAAGEIEELATLFHLSVPPPFLPYGNHIHNPESQSKPKKRSRIGKVLMILCCLVVAVLLISFIGTRLSGNTTSLHFTMTVEEQEKADPGSFLDATGKYRKNFWGDKVNIDGTIISRASVANFKDVIIRVTFFSATETAISEKDYVIYDFVPAGRSKAFKLKVEWPSGAKTCGWDAINATPY